MTLFYQGLCKGVHCNWIQAIDNNSVDAAAWRPPPFLQVFPFHSVTVLPCHHQAPSWAATGMLRRLTLQKGWINVLSSSWPSCSVLCQRAASNTVTRNPAYSELNEDDVQYFKDVLGQRGVVEDELALESMNK